jgi:glutamate-ammonia-ligase adenylyltransferase
MPDERPSAIESFIRMLPDPAGARAFLDRLEAVRPVDYKRNQLLLSRLLTIAAYSPFLAETVLRHPEYIDWLHGETGGRLDSGKTTEQLSEDLARFVTRMIDGDVRTRLARFKRRELLRIYLRDCLAIATLSEVTEELSNLADVILGYALKLAYQEASNRHGAPQARGGRGRIEAAEFAIVALGKLGCRELNYASDIDLLFLYAGAGETAGDGRRRESVVSNKEFFTAVAESVVRMIGSNTGEGAVYRIDLRLRPYGRDGDTVWEVERAADYYHNKAHNWERQALIRARAAAGSEAVVARFLGLVRDVVFAADSLPGAFEEVRKAKEKIDRKAATRTGGFNVKLGRGGIREIEFIAQALQLEYGGREPWVRTAQTLIVIARLAEKGYLTEAERARLSAAYTFLRTVEHRLQMEHGAQTHTLPVSRERLRTVARRCGYAEADDAATQFTRDLEAHTAAVRAIYNRVFADAGPPQIARASGPRGGAEEEIDDETARLIKQTASAVRAVMATLTSADSEEEKRALGEAAVEQSITSALASAINPLRSLRNLYAWADSLATYTSDHIHASGWSVLANNWPALIERLVPTLSSQYLSHILVSRPALACALVDESVHGVTDFYRVIRRAVAKESGPAQKADALRRVWYRLIVEIGYKDMVSVGAARAGARDEQQESSNPPAGHPPMNLPQPRVRSPEAPAWRLNNLEQTGLAEAALRAAVEIALESLGLRAVRAESLPFAILGLGRLGHSGMDYGSDLDLLMVFDDAAEWPPPRYDLPQSALTEAASPRLELMPESNALARSQSPQEFYARLGSELVHTLSSITREGLLYRIDLRLRPEGKSGPLAQGMSGLLSYLAQRASAWEHSAYLKAREVAGNLELGERARLAICEACFDAASRNSSLKEELAGMRERLEKEKARQGRPDVKWGRGGMIDVYFITRYLQLRDRAHFPTEQGTTALILHLGARASLDAESTQSLYEGYSFLRRLDHWMRLLLDRPTPVLPSSQVALADLARALGFTSAEEFERQFASHTAAIRDVYDRLLR